MSGWDWVKAQPKGRLISAYPDQRLPGPAPTRSCTPFQPSVNRVALNGGPHISYQDVHMTVGISGMTPRGVMLGVGYARMRPYTRFHKSEDSFDVHALWHVRSATIDRVALPVMAGGKVGLPVSCRRKSPDFP